MGNAFQKFRNTLGSLDWTKSQSDKFFSTGNIEIEGVNFYWGQFLNQFFISKMFHWGSDTEVGKIIYQ